MFVIPILMDHYNLRCSIFEQAHYVRSCNITTAQASSDVSERAVFFTPGGQPESIILSAGHNRANTKEAVTVTHLGPLEENPVSIQAPGDARSLSYGRAVCTFSFDTIRSTTLTRETVTATVYLLH